MSCRARLPLIAALFGFIFTLITFYPGFMSTDSFLQLHEARSQIYEGWHPPIMSWIWGYWDFLIPGPFGMLLFHNLMFWSGFLLIVHSCHLSERLSAILILFFGFLPPTLAMLAMVWKDVGLGCSLTLAFAILWAAQKNPTYKLWKVFFALLLIFYGLSVRHNAAPAILPFLFWATYLIFRRPEKSSKLYFIKFLLITIFVFFLILKINEKISKNLTNSREVHPIGMIFYHDMVGISVLSKQMYLPSIAYPEGEEHLEVADLMPVYNFSYMSISYNELGGAPGRKLKADMGDEPKNFPIIVSAWKTSVLSHPFLYLLHRWKVFSGNVLQMKGSVCGAFSAYIPQNDLGIDTHFSKFTKIITHGMWLTKDILFRGWIVLASLLLCLYMCRWMSRSKGPALVLISSGLLYILPYFFFSVDCDYRYIWWAYLTAIFSWIVVISGLPSRRDSILKIAQEEASRESAKKFVPIAKGPLFAFIGLLFFGFIGIFYFLKLKFSNWVNE